MDSYMPLLLAYWLKIPSRVFKVSTKTRPLYHGFLLTLGTTHPTSQNSMDCQTQLWSKPMEEHWNCFLSSMLASVWKCGFGAQLGPWISLFWVAHILATRSWNGEDGEEAHQADMACLLVALNLVTLRLSSYNSLPLCLHPPFHKRNIYFHFMMDMLQN